MTRVSRATKEKVIKDFQDEIQYLKDKQLDLSFLFNPIKDDEHRFSHRLDEIYDFLFNFKSKLIPDLSTESAIYMLAYTVINQSILDKLAQHGLAGTGDFSNKDRYNDIKNAISDNPNKYNILINQNTINTSMKQYYNFLMLVYYVNYLHLNLKAVDIDELVKMYDYLNSSMAIGLDSIVHQSFDFLIKNLIKSVNEKYHTKLRIKDYIKK